MHAQLGHLLSMSELPHLSVQAWSDSDSKNPGGAVLSFTGSVWASFTHDLKNGRYDSHDSHD
jgi:hypothetical protein